MTGRSNLSKFELVVHATHEAGIKVGGIGAALDGMLGSGAYLLGVQRTILVGPMNTRDDVEMERLVSSGNKLEVEYSSYHGLDKLDRRLSAALGKIEASFNVRILYGRRNFSGAKHEIILVDATEVVSEKLNYFKRRLYDKFGLRSDRYERDPLYSFYVNAAEPSYLALKTLVGNSRNGERFMIAHEFMGLPLLYSAMLHDPGVYHPAFCAHGVATVRAVVENSYGHDTMFYNTMRRAQDQGLFLGDIFGDQSDFFKHAMLETAVKCDNILAVSDLVVDELRFLSPALDQAHIDLVYNGLSVAEITLEDKLASKARLAQYAVNLGLYEKPPDFVFTHVTRFVPSKAMWRDVRVLEHLDELLKAKRKRAVLYVLATAVPGGRRVRDVYAWEQEYGWPVAHREGNGDLRGGEIDFYQLVQAFNAKAKAVRIVLVNQFGWSRERCGERMPEDMTYNDIRWGSDLEFSQSIYEPFGISQLEPMSLGALCVASNVCGSIGFIRQAAGGELPDSFIVADYTTLPEGMADGDYRATQVLGQPERDVVEAIQAQKVAQEIMARLPTTKRARERLLKHSRMLSQQMSWDVVVEKQLLPALVHAANQ
jgi:hypothetical protein